MTVPVEPVSRSGQSDRTKAPVPPLALWVRGTARLDELADRSVAIVGSRASTAYGEHVAGELGHAALGLAVLFGRFRDGEVPVPVWEVLSHGAGSPQRAGSPA